MARIKVSKESVNYREGSPSRHCGNCIMFRNGLCDLVKGSIDSGDVCDRWEAKKSAETPSLEASPDLLGMHGLWHTPDKHTGPQKLPNYIEHIAHALIRTGMDESRAIATAINAVKRWAKGHGNVHPEVVSASQRALDEWEKLKESHH